MGRSSRVSTTTSSSSSSSSGTGSHFSSRKNPALGFWLFSMILVFAMLVIVFIGIHDQSVQNDSSKPSQPMVAVHSNTDRINGESHNKKTGMRGSYTIPKNNILHSHDHDLGSHEDEKKYPDVDKNHYDGSNHVDNQENNPAKHALDHDKRKQTIQNIRKEFYNRYGGETEAMSMLKRGVVPASSVTGENSRIPIQHTAERIVLAKKQNDGKFVMSFGGYSVTVGRGNYYHQSYPFIMKNVLAPIFEEMDMELIVRNSAIGGIPSFPYGWCLPNFLGKDPDVVSWDYGMNEGQDADAFESYLRQSVTTLDKRPMMILLDTKKSRVQMLKSYFDNGVLVDSISVGRADSVVNKEILQMEEKDRPLGFQRWDEWGAPKGSPGQSSWHPKMMEHELIGWMIAMHFLDAVEMALDMMQSENLHIDKSAHEKLALLPPPVSQVVHSENPETPSHLLYGIPITNENNDNASEKYNWHMDPVSCRTSFLPNIQGGLSDIVVSGLVEDVGDDLKSRDDSMYNSGWVVDVGKVERDTKRKVERVGGLGYIDMKNAFYGIPQSGTLRLSIPHEGPIHDHSHDLNSDMLARHWFDTLVFCEVNEKRGPNECKPETDMTFIVGGVKSESVVQITNAAAYLKKLICINVGIPADSRVNLENENGDEQENDVVTLTVDVFVSNDNVTRESGACSISHVVWQSH